MSSNGSGPGSLTKVAPVTAFKAAVPCRKGFGDRKSKAAQGRGLPKKRKQNYDTFNLHAGGWPL